MEVRALTVCVNYADFLALSIKRWMSGLTSLTVVTDLNDMATEELCSKHGAQLFRTNAFTRNGGIFNKGAAMEEGRQSFPFEGWILFFDADVIPPRDWKERIESARPRPGNLYGCRRVECPDISRIDDPHLPPAPHDVPGVGFFQLFHASDPVVQKTPLLDTHWIHAGNYDSAFLHLWPRQKRTELPLRLVHTGSRDNWFGRGNTTAFDAMQSERKRRGGRWDHEVISGPTPVD
jgi:hypothetical protein